MELAYKPNWPEARGRLLAFWEYQIIDRPCIAVTARGSAPRPIPAPRDCQTRWADPAYVAASYDAQHAATWHGGEALPGTSLMAGYCWGFGAKLHYSEQTIWQDPVLTSLAEPPALAWDPADWGWQQVQAVVQRCVEVAAGKWQVGWPNVHQPNDHLALLRGSQEFLLDLVDHPQQVRAAQRQVLDAWLQIAVRLEELLAPQEGSSSWLSIWSPRRRNVTLQSDLSCMLSPELFEFYVVPELEELTAWAGSAVYHLDGPGALQHLDRLLSLPRVHAIQWTPGTGQAGGLAWLELYQRIQAAGKGLVISLPFDEVEAACRILRPEGLFILTGAASPAEGEELLTRVAAAT
ncbi:MAG: hypothetical protein IT204_01995 [Fimbriimonadaceae bacterium]|nr:hypothetical protein [Fimbriimonadaceae bacterium]